MNNCGLRALAVTCRVNIDSRQAFAGSPQVNHGGLQVFAVTRRVNIDGRQAFAVTR
jgi:hypothetical protein